MIRRIIQWYKIWKLKKEISSIDKEIEDFYLNLLCKNDEFQRQIDIDHHYKRFLNLRNIEKKELKRQINKLKK
jgi:hypothetical protein